MREKDLEDKFKICWDCDRWYIGKSRTCAKCGNPLDVFDSVEEALEEAENRGIEASFP